MNKKNQTKIDAGRYEAPKIKVKELIYRGVICQSAGINPMDEDENTGI